MTLAFPRPPKPLVSKALRKSARGRSCTIRFAPDCDGGGETTVLAHIRGTWSGIGEKPSDTTAVYACYACHDHLDGRRQPRVPSDEVLRALVETQQIMLSEGLISVRKP